MSVLINNRDDYCNDVQHIITWYGITELLQSTIKMYKINEMWEKEIDKLGQNNLQPVYNINSQYFANSKSF